MHGSFQCLGNVLLGAICGALLGYLAGVGWTANSIEGLAILIVFLTVPLGAVLGAFVVILWVCWRDRSQRSRPR
jgi:hypothetical protein